MKQFNDSKNVFGETRNFMNTDFPVQHRAKFSFILNFKKLLAEWQFEIISTFLETSKAVFTDECQVKKQ